MEQLPIEPTESNREELQIDPTESNREELQIEPTESYSELLPIEPTESYREDPLGKCIQLTYDEALLWEKIRLHKDAVNLADERLYEMLKIKSEINASLVKLEGELKEEQAFLDHLTDVLKDIGYHRM